MEPEQKGTEKDLASALQRAAEAALNAPALPSSSHNLPAKVSPKRADLMKTSSLYSGGGTGPLAVQHAVGHGSRSIDQDAYPDVLHALKSVELSGGYRTGAQERQLSSESYYHGKRGSVSTTPRTSGHWQQYRMSSDETLRRPSNRASCDIPRIDVVRPSQQDPMAMERMSYEHAGPPTIIRDADGQEYLVQPVRESLDVDRNSHGADVRRCRDLSFHDNERSARQTPNRKSSDDLYSPFGGPIVCDDVSAPSHMEERLHVSENAVLFEPPEQTRDTSGTLSGGSAGTVGAMYFSSLRNSCPVNIEVRSSFLNPLESGSLPSSLPDESTMLSRHASGQGGQESWEIDFHELQFGPRIGRGAYGEVFRGLYRETEVAIKLFLEQDLSQKVIDGFKREVAILRTLRHPNILQFMGACTTPPNLCIVSEFEPNGSLFKLLHRSEASLRQEQKVQMALDTAIGMHYLHTSKPPIIHGDLKSANLLLNHDFRVKVCDFGLSRVKLSAKLSVGSKLGTPEWTAPEVLQSSVSNEASDVYSFGVVLWEIWTGKIPWEELNPTQVIITVGFHNERLPIPDDIDDWVRDLIQDCFKRADQRPSFQEIILRLRTARSMLDD